MQQQWSDISIIFRSVSVHLTNVRPVSCTSFGGGSVRAQSTQEMFLRAEKMSYKRLKSRVGKFIPSHLEAQGSGHVCSHPAVIVCLVQQGGRQSQGGGGVGGHSGVTLSRVAEEETQRVHVS